MNALTKVLVFLVLVLSVGFAASQMILYGKREKLARNYRDARQALATAQEDLEETGAELTDTRDQLNRVSAELRDQVAALQEKLQDQREEAQELNASLEQQRTHVGQLTQLSQKLQGRVEILEGNIEEQDGRIAELQGTVNQKQARIGELQDVIAQKDSAIGDLRHELNETKKERTELVESNARLNGIVQQFRERGFEVPPAPAPAINAVVVRVDEQLNTAVIDKGSEADVKPNTEFTIYNDTGFVATLVIHDVWDTVAGGLVTRQAPGRQIEVGDKATTEIQVR
jgi:predicted nuclease with TOPRIM domain